MKKEIVSLYCVFALLGGTTTAFAGAYGEQPQAEELPSAPPPAPAPAPTMAPAPAAESEVVLREFAGFLTDAETSRGFWAEVGSIYASETDYSNDLDAVSTFLHLSYGQKLWEVGALLPYGYVHEDHFGSDDGLGDLSLWGKVLPVRTDIFQFGGGLVASFPTGNDSFSSNEYGFEPFVTGAVAAGPTSLRASFGYLTSTGHGDDALDTEVALLAPIGDCVVLRGEVLWFHGMDMDVDPVTFAPGVDLRFPLSDSLELLLRPTGGVGLNDEAPDWQLGVSVALTQIGA